MPSLEPSFQKLIQRLSDDLPVIKRMGGYWQDNANSILAEWALLWVTVWFVLHAMRGARGARAVKLIATPLILGGLFFTLTGGNDHLRLARLNQLYNDFLIVIGLVLLVVFQPELRRTFAHLGEFRFAQVFGNRRRRMVGEVCGTVDYLAKNRIGALIAIERHISLDSYLESAAVLDAVVSKELLSTLFWPGSMLHDMGVVVRDERVVAASAQFPLADAGLLPQQLGSRHRAALGLSLETDALVVVVSEETGIVSLLHKGQLRRNLTTAELRSLLERGLPMRTFFGLGRKTAGDPLSAATSPASPATSPAASPVATEETR